jgi:hypothetical protein
MTRKTSNKTTTTNQDNITGRDGFIIRKALAYAIEAIESLPKCWQERSDTDEMIQLLNAATADPDYFRIVARSHLERRGIEVKNARIVLAKREPGVVVPFWQ